MYGGVWRCIGVYGDVKRCIVTNCDKVARLNFIRLLLVVITPSVTEGLITTRTNRMKSRLLAKRSCNKEILTNNQDKIYNTNKHSKVNNFYSRRRVLRVNRSVSEHPESRIKPCRCYAAFAVFAIFQNERSTQECRSKISFYKPKDN